jgi:hypothetical protein
MEKSTMRAGGTPIASHMRASNPPPTSISHIPTQRNIDQQINAAIKENHRYSKLPFRQADNKRWSPWAAPFLKSGSSSFFAVHSFSLFDFFI